MKTQPKDGRVEIRDSRSQDPFRIRLVAENGKITLWGEPLSTAANVKKEWLSVVRTVVSCLDVMPIIPTQAPDATKWASKLYDCTKNQLFAKKYGAIPSPPKRK
jgi:uncharacterized protein YegP (UPF0339 family)